MCGKHPGFYNTWYHEYTVCQSNYYLREKKGETLESLYGISSASELLDAVVPLLSPQQSNLYGWQNPPRYSDSQIGIVGPNPA